jgi:hypothetical protein
VKPGGPRLIEQLGGEKVVTLVFMNNDLLYRHMRTCEAGCAWDYAEYQPHITVAEAPANASDLRTMEPYQGAIELGPEIFQEIDDNWSAVMAADGYSQEIASE